MSEAAVVFGASSRPRRESGPSRDRMSFSESSAATAAPSREPARVRRRDQQARQPRVHRHLEDAATHRRDPPRLPLQRHRARRASRSAAARRSASGASNHRNRAGSLWPHECSASSVAERSTRRISGSAKAGKARSSRGDQSRMQRPGAGTARSARPLIGRRPADPLQRPSVHAARRVVSHEPRLAAVDDRPDALDRQRRLGDVRAEDDLPPLARPERRGPAPPEPSEPCSGSTTAPAASAIGSSRRQARRISAIPGRKTSRCPDSRGSSSHSRTMGASASGLAGRSAGAVLDRRPDGSAPRRPRPDIRPGTRDRPGVERRGHHHQEQVGPDLIADLAQERQRQVGLQVPLVELVEHDGADRLEEGVGEELAGQDALGDEAEARRVRIATLESDLVADLSPSSQPRSSATRRAAARAAIRRGWRTTTLG